MLKSPETPTSACVKNILLYPIKKVTAKNGTNEKKKYKRSLMNYNNVGFTHDAEIFTMRWAFECIILMIIACSASLFSYFIHWLQTHFESERKKIVERKHHQRREAYKNNRKRFFLYFFVVVLALAFVFHSFSLFRRKELFVSVIVLADRIVKAIFTRFRFSHRSFIIREEERERKNGRTASVCKCNRNCFDAQIMLWLFIVIVKFCGFEHNGLWQWKNGFGPKWLWFRLLFMFVSVILCIFHSLSLSRARVKSMFSLRKLKSQRWRRQLLHLCMLCVRCKWGIKKKDYLILRWTASDCLIFMNLNNFQLNI